jgi:hypothetical protein
MNDKEIITKVFNENTTDIMAEKIIVNILKSYGIEEKRFSIANDIVKEFIAKGVDFN